MAAANSGSVGRGKLLWPQGKVDAMCLSAHEGRGHGFEPHGPVVMVRPAVIEQVPNYRDQLPQQ